jgi:hypothetical protein
MSYYPTPGAPYVPQQPVNPYGGMGTVGLSTPLPNTQMQQAQPQRPQPMNGQQPVQQSAQDGGWLLGRPVSSREEFLAIPSDLYGRWTYCPDLRSGVIYCKRLNPNTCESDVLEFYSPERFHYFSCSCFAFSFASALVWFVCAHNLFLIPKVLILTSCQTNLAE